MDFCQRNLSAERLLLNGKPFLRNKDDCFLSASRALKLYQWEYGRGSILLTGSQTMTLADAMQSGIQPAAVQYGTVQLHLSQIHTGARRQRSGTRRGIRSFVCSPSDCIRF